MNAGGYTYMRVATTDGDMWTAVRETKVKTGDNVRRNLESGRCLSGEQQGGAESHARQYAAHSATDPHQRTRYSPER